MVGLTWGKWKILEEVPSDEKWVRYFKCQCQCGLIKIKAKTELRKGRGQGCNGCAKEKHPHLDIIGKKFNKWTVIRYVGRGKKNLEHRFETRCDCGVIGEHSARVLKKGRSPHCYSCRSNETAAKRKLKKEVTDLRNKDKEVVIPSINNDNWTSDYAGRATLTPEDYLKQKENIYR